MRVAETVERAQIGIGTVRHRYHVFVAQFHECQRVHHSLGNDNTLLTDTGVDIPGYHFAFGLHGKVLVGGLILYVHHSLSLAKSKSQTVALRAAHVVVGRAHACFLGCFWLYLSLQQVVDGHCVEGRQVGGRWLAPVVFLYGLVVAVLLHLAADDEVEPAVVALSEAGVQIEPDARFVFVDTFAVGRAVWTGAARNGAVAVLVALLMLDVQLVHRYDVITCRCLLPLVLGFKVLCLHGLECVDALVLLMSRRPSSS